MEEENEETLSFELVQNSLKLIKRFSVGLYNSKFIVLSDDVTLKLISHLKMTLTIFYYSQFLVLSKMKKKSLFLHI